MSGRTLARIARVFTLPAGLLAVAATPGTALADRYCQSAVPSALATGPRTVTTTCTFDSGDSLISVPADVQVLHVEAIGGQGGNSDLSGSAGADVTGSVDVVPGESLAVYVGGDGRWDGAPGANGGGSAGYSQLGVAGGGGGGWSGIEAMPGDITSALIVAAGGGGAGSQGGPQSPFPGGDADADGTAGAVGCEPASAGDFGGNGEYCGATSFGADGAPGKGADAAGGTAGGGGGGGVVGGGSGVSGGGGGGESFIPAGGTISKATTHPEVVISYTVPAPPRTSLNPQGSLSGGSPYTLTFQPTLTPSPGSTVTDAMLQWGDGTAATDFPAPATSVVSASHTYAHPGTYLTTIRVSDSGGSGSSDSVIVTVTKAPSALTPGVGVLSGTTLTLSATLKRTDTNSPLVAKTVYFGAGSRFVCAAATAFNGTAKCSGTAPLGYLPANGYTAVFNGDQDTIGSSTTGSVNIAGTTARTYFSGARVRLGGLGGGRVLRGTASRGVRLVQVSVKASAGSGCRVLSTGGRIVNGHTVRGWCVPRFLTAHGTTRWTLALRHRLRAGTYWITLLARDRRGRYAVHNTRVRISPDGGARVRLARAAPR